MTNNERILILLLAMADTSVPECTYDPLPVYWHLPGLGDCAFWMCGDRVCAKRWKR